MMVNKQGKPGCRANHAQEDTNSKKQEAQQEIQEAKIYWKISRGRPWKQIAGFRIDYSFTWLLLSEMRHH
jgi:hypothetical protein